MRGKPVYRVERGNRPTGMNTAIADILAGNNAPMPIGDLAEAVGVRQSVVETRVQALVDAKVVNFDKGMVTLKPGYIRD
jgi:hypothetical protein